MSAAEIQLAVQSLGGILWRNNSGAAKDAAGRPIRFGLGNISAAFNDVFKSSDFIGIDAAGRFLAIEVKPAGWTYRGDARERAQLAFINDVRRRGGVAGFATCADDVKKIMIGA